MSDPDDVRIARAAVAVTLFLMCALLPIAVCVALLRNDPPPVLVLTHPLHVHPINGG